MKLNKKVTVLLSVYNGEDYIKNAIISVLEQTYTDFDLLLMDDGSTDKSAEIIHSFEDDRIKYIKNEQNMGLTKTLNKGLNLIEGEYIIRMDSDDICYPERFEKQIKYMDENKHLVVSGSNVRQFSATGWDYKTNVNTKPEEIRTELLFNCPLKHPSVIMRNSIIKKENYQYSTEHIATEDFGLWRKISEKYDLGNLKNVLMDYRIHDQGISVQANKKRESRDKAHILIYKESFDRLGIAYTDKDLTLFRCFVTHSLEFSEENSKQLSDFLFKIKNVIKDNPKFDVNFYEKLVSGFFRMNFQRRKSSASELLRTYNSYFKPAFKMSYIDIAKLNIKNLQTKF